MHYLKFRVSGPLMHFTPHNIPTYKHSSDRQTSLVPTRRTVVGMLGCALGLPVEKLGELNDNLKDIRYQTIKEGGLLSDFQTHGVPGNKNIFNRSKVEAFKDIGTEASREMCFKYSANGKSATISFEPYSFKRMDGGTVFDENASIKKVYYVTDAEFNVYIGANDDMLAKIRDAINNPYWIVYVGIAKCIPNILVANDDFEQESDIYDYNVCL